MLLGKLRTPLPLFGFSVLLIKEFKNRFRQKLEGGLLALKGKHQGRLSCKLRAAQRRGVEKRKERLCCEMGQSSATEQLAATGQERELLEKKNKEAQRDGGF